jgi:two-component system, response regulator PdtaR
MGPNEKAFVLVVEDEILQRCSAVARVEEAGFAAIGASDADEAIDILENRNDVRAVFTDVQMPGSMDGLRLVWIVKERWPPLALIVTSGKTDIPEADLPAGGRFLPKPYQRSKIASALRQLIA